jgi:transposase
MLNLEGFMNVRDLKQQGWSVSAIAEQLDLDRKTVRKYLLEQPQPYKREHPAPCKIDPIDLTYENAGRTGSTMPANYWKKFAAGVTLAVIRS